MTNTIGEKMKLKNVIVWILLLGIIVLLMSTSVQAEELTEVNATDILEQIENGEDIYRENVRIKGELDLSEIELKTIPNTRTEREISLYDLEEELKIVESKIEIHDSVFEDDVDFSNTQFRKDIDFSGTSFLGEINFRGANFAGYTSFWGANFAGYTSFWDANFAGDAGFWDANFGSDAGFWFANFAGDAGFGLANFAGDADFGLANFAGDADFELANFAGNATFDSTEFNKLSFTRSTFTNVSLGESEFNQMKVEWMTLKDALPADGLTYIKLIKNWDQSRFGAQKS